MKKSTLIKLILAAASVVCAVYLVFRYADRIPFLSRFTDDEIEPEEDLFESTEEFIDNIEELSPAADALPEHEEKRQSRVRRGYIPLRLHEQEDL